MNRRAFIQYMAAGAVFSVAGLALPAEAQRHERVRVQNLIRQLKRDTDTLRNRVDRLERRDRIEGRRADRLRDRVRELENAADRLDTGITRSRVFTRNVSRNEMNAVLRAGNRVQEILVDEERWRSQIGPVWYRVRDNLNQLARIYGLPTLRDRR